MQVSAAGLAQKINLSKSNVPLKAVLKEIRTQSGYDFVYAEDIFDVAKPVNIQVKDAELQDVLKEIFKAQPLTFTISKTTVTIQPKEPTFLERLANRWASIDASGRVVDSENRPLPGASVKVKKTGKAVSTDKDGRFFLRGVEEGAVLVVSFIGYLTKEIKAAKELGDVVLELSTSKLDEVQVIAYGTTTQRLSTGNVTTIKTDVIEKQPVNNPLLALQGRVPGLFIEQATGFAGTGVKVRIQGQNSLNNGSDPLYVIDGVPYNSQLLPGGNPILGGSGAVSSGIPLYGNPLNFINPSDIESIDILKDADATAIYGSRAANGAILITTKKGKSGDTRVNVNLQSGWGSVPRKLDLMNSQQYLEMRREAMKNDNITEPTPGNFGDNDLNGNWDNSRYTDWQEELIGKTAVYQDINASISGGTGQTTYLLGTGYHKETNVFPGDYADQKASVHFNLNNTSLNQRFKVQLSASYMYDHNQLPYKDLTQTALTLAPVAPEIYQPDGSLNWEPDKFGNTTFFNPVGFTFDKFLTKTNNLTSNLLLSYELLPRLTLSSSFGYNNMVSNSVNKFLQQSTAPEFRQYVPRSTIFVDNNINSFSIEPQLNYHMTIGKGILEALLGATLLQNRNRGNQIGASGFSNDLVMDDIMSASTVTPASSVRSVYKYNALFGRLNYNWQNKYILNLTGRRDGSSRFGPKSRFHNFIAGGAAWVFSEEGFLKNNLSFISFGKLWASYGTTGSDQIGDYRYLSLLDPAYQVNPYQNIVLYKPSRITNPYLEWEETRKLQVGLELGFFSDKILLNSTYYRNHSSNQLSDYSLPLTTGFSNIIRNQTFKIRNSGWEVALSATAVQTQEFSWKPAFNITVPKSLLVDYPDILKSSASSTAIIGQPLSAERVYHFLGVDPETGIYQFADKSGNATSKPDPYSDKTVLVDFAPEFYGGFQNSLSCHGFQLDFLFSFVKQIARNYTFGILPAGAFREGLRNQPSSLFNRWQKPGDKATIQKYTTGFSLDQPYLDAAASDAGISDASYVRLKNVSLSWEIPKQWIKSVKLQGCNLFLQGQNLFTITNYSGLDPETKSSASLPTLRVITLGVKISL